MGHDDFFMCNNKVKEICAHCGSKRMKFGHCRVSIYYVECLQCHFASPVGSDTIHAAQLWDQYHLEQRNM